MSTGSTDYHVVSVTHPFPQSVVVWQGFTDLIEQSYYVTFWHSKVKTNKFIKYHTPVYDKEYTIKKASV